MGSHVLGWIRLVHTFPVVAVTAATAAIAIASGGDKSSPWRVVLLTVTMFFGQCSVGIQNDYLDRHRDAVAKPAKPIPSGLVGPRAALVASLLTAALFVTLGAALGPLALIVGSAAIGAGYAYNLFLKHTPFGGLAYIGGFGLLALWVWVATEALRPSLAWTFVFGAPLLGGLSIANAVPDLEGDRATSVKSLAIVLGWPAAGVVVWTGGALSIGLMILGATMVDVNTEVVGSAAALGATLIVAGLTASFRLHHHWLAFRLYAALTGTTAVGWILASR